MASSPCVAHTMPKACPHPAVPPKMPRGLPASSEQSYRFDNQVSSFTVQRACVGDLESSVPSSLRLSSPFTDSDSNFPLCPTLGRLNKPLAHQVLCLQPFLLAFTFLEHE